MKKLLLSQKSGITSSKRLLLFLLVNFLVLGNLSAQENLSISLSGPLTADPGDLITYTITYYNSGVTPAQNVVITHQLPLPDQFTYVSSVPAGIVSGNTISWTSAEIPILASLGSGANSISVTIRAGTAGDGVSGALEGYYMPASTNNLVSSVQISSNVTTPPMAGNSVTTLVNQFCGAQTNNVNVTIKSATDSQVVGLLQITNNGNVYDKFDLSSINHACPGETSFPPLNLSFLDENENPVTSTTWLAPGESFIVLIQLVAPNGTPANRTSCFTITTTSSICGTEFYSDLFVDIVGNPNYPVVLLSKIATPDPVQSGDTLTYRIFAFNSNDKYEANNFTIYENFPSNVTVIDVVVQQRISTLLSSTANSWTFSYLEYGIGTAINIIIRAVVNETAEQICQGLIHNQIYANYDEGSTGLINTYTNIQNYPDLVISKTAVTDPSPAEPDGTITYTLNYENIGNCVATNVMITDVFDNVYTENPQFISGPAGSVSGPNISWNIGEVAPGASGSISYSVDIKPLGAFNPGTTPIINLASISTPDQESDLNNNTASHIEYVFNLPDLSITKSVSPEPLQADTDATYTLTISNTGDIAATGVMVKDLLPDNLTFVSASDGGTLNVDGDVEWPAVASLAPGGSFIRTITVTPTCAAIGSVTNMAEVYSDQNDANEADNTYELISQVVDLLPPVISQCPAGYTLEGCSVGDITGLVYSETPVSLTLQEWTDAGGVASDNCGVTEWSYVDSSDGQCPIVVTRTWTVKDASGNATTCTQTINIDDTIAPTWTTAADALDLTLECSDAAALTAAQALFPVASDNCDADVSNIDKVSGSFVAGSECSQAGTYTNTWTVTDECGNTSATYTQVITVVDTTAPVISTQAQDQTVECDGTGNTAGLNAWLASNGGAVASDNCGGVTWSYSPNPATISDLCGATGAVTVTFRATDDCGLFSETTATFTIVDTTDPVFTTIPENLTLECDGAGNSTDLNDWLANVAATDDCGTVSITNDFTALSDLCGATGSATVTWTAEDDCANTTTTSATFTIVDTTNPVFTTIPENLTVECDGAGNTTDLNDWLANVAATDGCGTVTITNDFTALSDLCGATGSATVTWTATDDCGNTETTSAVFTIEDTTDPIFTTIPADLTVECDGAGNTTDLNDWLANVAATDDCGTVTITNDFTALSDLCGATGSATVTWTAEDDCGNTTTTSATFTIVDTTDPVFTTIPTNLTVECDGTGNTTQLNAWLADVAASDGCGTVTITNNFTALSDLCGATGSATVTWTATDACGNTETTSATFTITDTTDPVFTIVPANLTVECDGAGNTTDLNDWLANVAATDGCGDVTISHDFTALSDLCGATGSATVTWTATDDCGNTETTSATFTITDTTDPVFTTIPANLTVECDGEGNTSELNAWLANVAATDGCGGVTITNDFTALSDLCGATGSATVTWTATDDCGNTETTSAVFTIVDTTDPIFTTIPSDLTVECDGAGNTTDLNDWLADVAATDDCGTVTITNNFTALSDLCGATGSATVIWTATDDCGNTETTSATFTIEDTQAPVINSTLLADLTLECDGTTDPSGAIAAWLANNGGATAADNCGTVTWSHDYEALSDGCGATGTALVTFTATDACGLSSTVTANVTIEDTTPPAFTCPTSITVTADSGQDYATLVIPVPLVSESCGTVTLVNDFTLTDNASGQYPLGITTVTYTATDACGLITTCSFTVIVNDDEPPVITCPPAITVDCISEVPLPYATYAAFAAAGGSATDNDAIDESSFVLLSETSDDLSCPETITRVYQIADVDGNVSTCSQLIVVDDQVDPVFTTIPVNLTVECDGLGNADDFADWLANVAATDNCGEVTITNDFTALSDLCGATGSATVTWTATDDCGNTETTSAVFTIEDTTDPIFTTIPSDLTVECDGAGNTTDLNDWLADVAATDDCGTVTITNNFTALSDLCGATGSATITWTATDACGNTETTSATFTITDTTDPVFTIVPANLTVECDGEGNSSELNVWLANVAATDGCGGVTISNDFTALSDLCGATGSATVTWTATDDCGNTETTSATFTIEDTVPPAFTCPDDIIVTADVGQDFATLVIPVPVVSESCGAVTLVNDFTLTDNASGQYPLGITTVTYTATDACGLVTTCSFTVTVNDNEPPSISCPPAVTVECFFEVPEPFADYAAFEAAGGFATDNSAVNESSFILISETSDGLTCPQTITRVYQIADDEGNISQCSHLVIVDDQTPPVFTYTPPDLIVDCNGEGNTDEFNAWLASITVYDNCGTVFLTNDFTALSDDCGGTGSTLVTWTATDPCGNISTTSAAFGIADNTPPVFTIVPQDLIVECDGMGNTNALNAWLANVAAVDACGDVNITHDFTSLSDDCGATGTALVTWTATDDCGNTSTTSASFTIEDNTAPQFSTVPEDMIVECDGLGNTEALNAWLANVDASDVCGEVSITNDFISLSEGCGATGTALVTWTATDDCGNTATTSASFTIEDNTAPLFSTVPEDMIVECDGLGNTEALNAWLANVDASDVCGEVTITNDFTALSDLCGATGLATVTWTATDACGNTSSVTASFTIEDTAAPLFNIVPEDLIVECDGLGNTDALNAWLTNVDASDVCGEVTISNDFTSLSDDCGATGSATVTWTATDDCGNTSTTSATFTIEDTTAPTIICPDSPIVVVIGADETGYVAEGGEFDHLGIDDICGEVTATHNLEHSSDTTLDGYEFPLGDTEVIWTVTDDCGNTAECSFIVTVFAPSLLVTKIADPQTYSNVGEEINYTITVTNNGNAALSNVVVTDPLTGLNFTIETLLPGETVTFNETYTITYDDLFNGSVENTALAAGFDPEGNEVTQSATEIIYVVLDELQITLVSQTNVLCFGDETGAAEVQVSGGLAPYTIVWYTNPEQTGTVASNLPAGTYVVIVTDALGNTDTLTVVITQPEAPLNITYQVTNVLCNGAATGAVDVQVFGGTSPYSFQWSNGATTQNISELFAGAYSALIEDSNGCLLELEVEITEPDALYISDIVIEGVLCMEDLEGSIQFTVGGGVPPYTYLWSNDATTAGLVNVPGGDYWVEVTDANGCLLSYDFFIPYQEEDCELRFPQGVSPDGDGFNDTWVINGLIRFPNNNLRIFNRWGTIIYEAAPYHNDWDGRPNRGRPADGPEGILPTGTYFYVIELEPGMDPISGYIYLVK